MCTLHARQQTVRAWAPRCADRFYNLVKHGFFDNQRFYRVTPAYIQFGYHADRVVNEDIYQCVSLADGVCLDRND
jgi:cyclophilin family peptidyl-prolyl cis-trans isomerase